MNPKSDEHEQVHELFKRLDKNKDGKIDFDELNEYFREVNKSTSGSKDEQARKLFDTITSSSSNRSEVDNTNTATVIENFDFRDFVDYVNQTDRKIEIIFKNLDRDQNGEIDKKEIKEGFENLGICLNDSQIDKLLNHLDKNNSLQIDWKEWRDFFRFAPHDRFEEALRFWRQESFVDYADQAIPADFTPKEKQSGLWWRSLVAGGVAGAISRTCTAPLDRVRIFLQVHGVGHQTGGIVGTFRNMLKEGGVRSLWRGNFINVLKITPESAIKFGAYEHIKRMMGQEGQQLPAFQKFLSGTLAGFTAQSTIYPMEVLKTRLALRKTGEFNGISDCARKIYRKEGIRAFYRGYLMNTLGIAGVGVDLAIYETLKHEYKNLYPNSSQPSTLALLAISNTSSSLAMLSTYPIFLIRTKLQSSSEAKVSVFNIASKIWHTNGFFGFYKGSLANLAKVAPAASIGYISYEKTCVYLGISK